MSDLDLARRLVREGDLDTLELCFGNVSRVLSQLVRTAFIPEPGRKLLVTDFSAIEARVLSWLAGEKWRLEVFNTHGKIYEAAGARMFKKKIEEIKKGSVERDAAKIAELALGYQGGWRAIMAMIAQEKIKAIEAGKAWTFEPTEDEAKEIVILWRRANSEIVGYWYDVERAAIAAVKNPGGTATIGFVSFKVERGVLFCRLPSGRRLAYMRPKIAQGMYGDQIVYEGMNQTTKKWTRIAAYGGLFVENITQAIARDLLAAKICLLDAARLDIVGHVHDEVIIEDASPERIKYIDIIMGEPVSWAPGLPLKGDGFITDYYKKED
jgi:DNA polymerase